MYRINGTTDLNEGTFYLSYAGINSTSSLVTLDHFSGYCNTGPVLVGNSKASQTQFDIFGELMDSVYL
jgi:hypothetical protein